MNPVIALVCVLTFVHYVCAQMRGPVLALYAAAHGATPTGVGVILGAHMAVAAAGSIPLGRAADLIGRRALLLAGTAMTSVSSLLLPLVDTEPALAIVYGLAGLGVAAFTPSAMSIVGDVAAPGAAGRAYAWYATAHYGAIGVGPFVGGVIAQYGGPRTVFVVAGVMAAMTLGLGLTLAVPRPAGIQPSATGFVEIRANTSVWAGWLLAASGLLTQGVVFTFFPLLADQRGMTPVAIGLVFLILGVANTAARIPAGWLVDRTKSTVPYAVGGVLTSAIATALLPHAATGLSLWSLVAVFGATGGLAGVAIGVALAAAAPAARGLVMGGYSTALYLGLAIGSFAFGPLIARHGYATGFEAGAAASGLVALAAAGLWLRPYRKAKPT